MKIIDISQEVVSCVVYPGDKRPEVIEEMRMDKGDLYNLSSLSMCVHNGTHIDAPFHFFSDGNYVHDIPLEHFVGDCLVVRYNGDIDEVKAKEIIEKAKQLNIESKILIAGDVCIKEDAAYIFADSKIHLLGNEGVSVGPIDAPMAVHKILLGANIVLLEGIVLDSVDEGIYFLNAAPLNISGVDGSPCRAYLIKK